MKYFIDRGVAFLAGVIFAGLIVACLGCPGVRIRPEVRCELHPDGGKS